MRTKETTVRADGAVRRAGRLEGKVAVITGAGRGIGYATAERFVREGAEVVIAEIDADLAGEARDRIGDSAVAVEADVTNERDVQRLIETIGDRFGRLDVLVCNAGKPFRSTSLSTTEEEWAQCMDLNLRSAWLCARSAHDLLAASGYGSIVTVGSTQGLKGSKESFPYTVAKGGLLALTRSLAVEYASAGIRANAIIPGQIESVRTEPYFNSFRKPEEARRRVLSTFPLGRLGKPDDIANAALFLASDESAWITGIYLIVDGGRDAAMLDATVSR